MPRLFALILATGLSSLLCAGRVLAQSSSPQEESVRQRLLIYLRSTTTPTLAKLKEFYRRPEKPWVRLGYLKNPAAVTNLGRLLFFDPRLSKSKLTSCATCHNPSFFWTDGQALSAEGNSRRSMSLYNLAWDSRFTWNGSAGSLMSQAVLAVFAGKGMASDPFVIAAELNRVSGYRTLFKEAFVGVREGRGDDPVTPQGVLGALEMYVSSIISPRAPFDAWIAGDESAISAQAKQGFLLFNSKGGCFHCHNTWRFSDSRVYDIGLPGGSEGSDQHFKAVGLRNIAERPPYMHAGQLPTLEGVVGFYNGGGIARRNTQSPFIRPLGLDAEELAALVAFLKSLSGASPEEVLPLLPR